MVPGRRRHGSRIRVRQEGAVSRAKGGRAEGSGDRPSRTLQRPPATSMKLPVV
jgi:hypothetical protein